MRVLLSTAMLLLSAQSPTLPPTRDCAATLDAFRSKIDQNYAGARLEVVGDRRRQHDALFARLMKEAGTATGEACFFVLDRYVKFFDDPHLFVFQSTRLDTVESKKRASALGEVRSIDETTARTRLAGRQLDPIEGIWNDGEGLRVVVTREASSRDRFSAIVLTSDTAAWPAGAVRATIRKRGSNDYLVDLYARNFALRHLDGVIHKEVLLRLSPGLWAREFPAPALEGLVNTAAPRRPTIVVRGTTVIVSMASHDPTYRPVLDSLVNANRDVLDRAEKLIIDLRGNEGGGAFTSAALHPYIRSAVPRTHRYASDTAWMLSSPDQIVYARRGFGSDTSLFVRTLLSRLTESPGQLVPMPPFTADARGDTLTPGPSRVGVIVDGGTVSAGESLVLRALQSRRATVFGQPTAGALDYASVNVVRVLPDESRWLLGYGTITASNRLPVNGMREKGIAPDVRIRVDRLVGAIDEVERRLGKS